MQHTRFQSPPDILKKLSKELFGREIAPWLEANNSEVSPTILPATTKLVFNKIDNRSLARTPRAI